MSFSADNFFYLLLFFLLIILFFVFFVLAVSGLFMNEKFDRKQGGDFADKECFSHPLFLLIDKQCGMFCWTV